MSIVTDALNRVQAERSRPSGSTDAAPVTEGSPSSPSSKPNVFASQPPSKTIRNILRWSLIIVGLVSLGIGAYLWGLTLMPDVARVSPDQEVIPERLPQPTPEERASSPQVAEEPSVPATEGQELTTGSAPLGESASGDAVNPESSTQNIQSTEAQEVSSPQSESTEVVQEVPQGTTENPRTAEALPKDSQPTSPSPKEKAPLEETPQALPSETAQSVTPSAKANPSPQVKAPVRSSAKIATPTEAKLIQAKYLIQKRRYGHAMTILKPLFVTPPETWEPWFWLGTAHLGLEQFEQAEEAFLEGLSRNAGIPHLWVQRALVSQQRGLYGEAVEALRQAEMIAPDLPEVQLNLAYSLEAQGQIGVAVQHYQNFLAMTEGLPSFQAARKKVLERILRLEAA